MKLGRIGTILVVGGAAAAAGAVAYFASGGAAQAGSPSAPANACKGQALGPYNLVSMSASSGQPVTLCGPMGGKITSAVQVTDSSNIPAQIISQLPAGGNINTAISLQASFGGTAAPNRLDILVPANTPAGNAGFIVSFTDAAGKTQIALVFVTVTA
jgi:hypothetical protein